MGGESTCTKAGVGYDRWYERDYPGSFGEDGAPAVLGSYTLDSLALVNPIEKRLVPNFSSYSRASATSPGATLLRLCSYRRPPFLALLAPLVRHFSSTPSLHAALPSHSMLNLCLRPSTTKVAEGTEPPQPFVLGDLLIGYSECGIAMAERPVKLTATEHNVLFELSVNTGRVLTHEHLLRRVWETDNSGDAGLVRIIVKRLCREMGDNAKNPRYFRTQLRVGYRMRRDELRNQRNLERTERP